MLLNPPDLCPDRVQLFLQFLVPAVDVVDVADFGFPFRGHGGQKNGGAGTDVTAGDRGALELNGARYFGLVGVQKFELQPHLFKFVEILEAAVKKGFEHKTGALGLGEQGGKGGLKVGRKMRKHERLEPGRFKMG